MRVRLWSAVVCAGMLLAAGEANAQTGMTSCRRMVLSGEVSFGQPYEQQIGNGLRLMLEPLASGWILRVLPAKGPRGEHDYAELATPPYRSMTPLLISTDYSFRAQDAIGWNPREFHYAAGEKEFRQFSDIYDRYMRAPTPQLEGELAQLVEKAPEGEFDILDSRLIPGQANQAAMANSVVSHFTTTAHTLEQYDGKESRQLGRVLWLRFRIRLNLARGAKPAPGVLVESYPCVAAERPTSARPRASQP